MLVDDLKMDLQVHLGFCSVLRHAGVVLLYFANACGWTSLPCCWNMGLSPKLQCDHQYAENRSNKQYHANLDRPVDTIMLHCMLRTHHSINGKMEGSRMIALSGCNDQ